MALIEKQINQINLMKDMADLISKIEGLSYETSESWAENFATLMPYALDTEDLSSYGVTYSSLNAFNNQVLGPFVDFMRNVAVAARDRGADARKIMKINPEI